MPTMQQENMGAPSDSMAALMCSAGRQNHGSTMSICPCRVPSEPMATTAEVAPPTKRSSAAWL